MDLSRFASAALVAFVCLLVAGCGGGSDDSDHGGDDGGSAGRLEHVDGTVTASGGELTVTPEGGAAMTFTVGPAIERAALRALVASGATARVTYREDASGDIAVAAATAPEVETSLDSYEGTVTSITADKIVLDGDGGERSFTIGAAERDAFDVEHLDEHRDDGEAVRVYFRSANGADAAVSYEDA